MRKAQWPRRVRLGRSAVSVYQRATPAGGMAFMVANYSTGKRRFDCYPTEAEAIDAAQHLVRQMSESQVLAASMTNEDAVAYSMAVQSLKSHGVGLPIAADVLDKCLKSVGDLSTLLAAVDFYVARNRQLTRKPVSEVVAELIAVKESRRKSPRYIADLRVRLRRFVATFQQDTCDVSTPQVSAWLDSLNLSPQSYQNFRRVAHLLFGFAVARGYAADNPVTGTENLKPDDRDIEIYKPVEMRKLLAAAHDNFLPALVIGGFAGLRSAEIERLQWADIRLASRHIVVGAAVAKTACRRVVPISENLAAWLAPYAVHAGKVWNGGLCTLTSAMLKTAKRAGLKWKRNALRHSYATYRFAQITNAGQVAGEMGNSAAMVYRHYRELVAPSEAAHWFDILPEGDAANIVPMTAREN